MDMPGESGDVPTDARPNDIWRRRRDGAAVLVVSAVESWAPGEGRLVSWVDLGHPKREGICTEKRFLTLYRLAARTA